jgi:hypothetical protein
LILDAYSKDITNDDEETPLILADCIGEERMVDYLSRVSANKHVLCIGTPLSSTTTTVKPSDDRKPGEIFMFEKPGQAFLPEKLNISV